MTTHIEIIDDVIESSAAETTEEIITETVETGASEQIENHNETIEELTNNLEHEKWQNHILQLTTAINPIVSHLETITGKMEAVLENTMMLLSLNRPLEKEEDQQEAQEVTVQQEEPVAETQERVKNRWIGKR